jgi:hypothetical protein
VAGVVVFAQEGLTSPGKATPGRRYAALVIGAVLSLVVGVGLMALLFYSIRRCYDEPPTYPSPGDIPRR